MLLGAVQVAPDQFLGFMRNFIAAMKHPRAWTYARSPAATLQQSLGDKLYRRLGETLARIAADPQRDRLVQTLTLHLLGDVGLPPDSKILDDLNAAWPPNVPSSQAGVLLTVRARLRRPQDGDLDALRKLMNRDDADVEFRALALEGLVILSALNSDDKSATLATLVAMDQRPDASTWIREAKIRFLQDVAESPVGRKFLLAELAAAHPRLLKATLLKALGDAVAKDDKDWQTVQDAALAQALDISQDPAIIRAAAEVALIPDSASKDAITRFVHAAAPAPNPDVQLVAVDVLKAHKCALTMLPDVALLAPSPSYKVRVGAMRALDDAVTPDADLAPAFPLIDKGLTDPHKDVRRAAMFVVIEVSRKKPAAAQRFLPAIARAIRDATGPVDIAFAVIALEIVSQKNFKVESAPRNDHGDCLPGTDPWWNQHADEAQKTALAWAEKQGLLKEP